LSPIEVLLIHYKEHLELSIIYLNKFLNLQISTFFPYKVHFPSFYEINLSFSLFLKIKIFQLYLI